MRLLRTLALASASAVLLMGQAVSAFAHPQHEPSAVSVHWPGSLGHGQIPQPHGRQEGRLFDLGRYCRNHLHRRARTWVPWEFTTSRVIW